MMLSSMDLGGFIQFKLDLDAFNFTQWHSSINFLHARHHVQDHVRHGHANRLADPDWPEMDNNIVLWFLYHRGGLLDVVALPESSTYMIWARLHEYFFDNQVSRTLHLGQEFHAAVLGDLSINDYCCCLQHVAMALLDLGKPVSNCTHPPDDRRAQEKL